MDKSLCTIVINSCDKYEAAWYPFFELIKKYWEECKCNIVLNTETKNYKHEGLDITVVNFEGESDLWGKRFKECLGKIDTPFVIILLEDFFIQKEVDFKELENCFEFMNLDENIIAIYFKRIFGFDEISKIDSNYILMKENKKYKLNLQAGLWRRKELYKLVNIYDSPWDFEDKGYKRILAENSKFLCSKNGTHRDLNDCVFPYLTDRRKGYGIWRGKWLWNNTKLFNRNDIIFGELNMDVFTKFDMIKYYIHRIICKIKLFFR